MTPARLNELADRVEAATGPNFELERQIWIAIGSPAIRPIPVYTASLDAAMTLVPESWYRVEQQQTREGAWAKVTLLEKGFTPADEGHAATPALALTAAALRARARAMEGE